MPLPNINLDDRKFEDLYQELVRRIPTYTPEWTDYNDSDPWRHADAAFRVAVGNHHLSV